jgi:hypothetical protein
VKARKSSGVRAKKQGRLRLTMSVFDPSGR